MKKFLFIFLILPSLLFAAIPYKFPPVVRAQDTISLGRVMTTFWNTGVFNQQLEYLYPAMQWPSFSGKFVGLSAGLSMGAYFNGELRLSNATYLGEFAPGWIINANGGPRPKTSDSYHLYKVSRGDIPATNPDYLYWGDMVNVGAPYDDVNLNGIFDLGIDIPGVKNAEQTIFVYLTDGFSENHSIAEGFSGGTAPLYADMQFTAWSYGYPGFEDVQFIKYYITNKSLVEWKKTHFSMFFHSQIGDSLDDFVGCDTLRRLGYAYNRDNSDGTGEGNSYGANPPAVGMKLLYDSYSKGMTSFHYTIPLQFEPSTYCEDFPYNPQEAYNLMRGYKKDNTSWVDPTSASPKKTKYTFPGDPETGSGWTEYNGTIDNCGGSLTGTLAQNSSRERTFLMSTGADDWNLPCPSYITLNYAQMVARGNSNTNSVTKLKELADKVQLFFDNQYTIGVTPISSIVPDKFSLHQNYPNPFNPTTNIKFDITKSDFVSLKVFDINGREVANLVSENLKPGTYEVNFPAVNLSSGIYFYQLRTNSFVETKRMSLIK